MVEVSLGVLLTALLGVGAFYATRWYQSKGFKQSLRVEFRDLQYKLACDGFLLYQKTCRLTREFLDWCDPICDEYQGRDPNPEVVKGRKAFDKLNDEQLKIVCEMDRNSELEKLKGLVRSEIPQRKELPLLEADVKGLSLFPAEYQKMVLDIKTRVRWFNQGADELEHNHRRLDTPLSAENVAIVRLNIHEGCVKLADLSFELGKRIGKFLEKD